MEKKLSVSVNNIYGIKELTINLRLDPDVYAITGVNGIGKSTLFSCISPRLKRPVNFSSLRRDALSDNSSIVYRIDDKEEKWTPSTNDWQCSPEQQLYIRGFQEGSITKGTRFSNVSSYGYYKKMQNVDPTLLLEADPFVIKGLGQILHNDEEKYQGLYRLDRTKAERYYNYKGVPYFLKIGSKFVSQFELSTGELLLINLLHLFNVLLYRTNNAESLNLILIDEIELALHPSAIKRLVQFTKGIAKRYHVAIYFSTHSLEIIHALPIDNLFYLHRLAEGHIKCETPCYPAYITRDIYAHHGYDVLVLVEDILAKILVEKYIIKGNLDRNKRIRVMPVGGYDNTLDLHESLLIERVLYDITHIISIIDGDVKANVESKREDEQMWDRIPDSQILFLPIQSLEKFLKAELFDKKNMEFRRIIRDKLFEYESEINWFENEYIENIRNKQNDDRKKSKPILPDEKYFVNGKNLFSILKNAFIENGGNERIFRETICNIVLEYGRFSPFESQLDTNLRTLFV